MTLEMTAETWIAAGSLTVSVIAFVTALRADARGRAVTRTQIFLDLRTRFLDVLEGLPAEYRDPGWDASEPADRAAAVRYWHHAFDEWYVSRRLNAALMKEQWSQFYLPAIRSGLEHPGLERTLRYMLTTQPTLARLWSDFCADIGVRRLPE
jgi:hypothetical protein